mgnify:CR=1 FL=1
MAVLPHLQFLAYLRGIETGDMHLRLKTLPLFLAYLRGIETSSPLLFRLSEERFLAYLRGIETYIVW